MLFGYYVHIHWIVITLTNVDIYMYVVSSPYQINLIFHICAFFFQLYTLILYISRGSFDNHVLT